MENPADWVLHARSLQESLDAVVTLLGSVLDGDSRPFADPDFQPWRARRDAQ